jgi:hypothetical protein
MGRHIRDDARHNTLVIAEEKDTERHEDTREVTANHNQQWAIGMRIVVQVGLHQGLARKAMDGSCAARHDEAETAFDSGRRSFTKIRYLNRLLVEFAR